MKSRLPVTPALTSHAKKVLKQKIKSEMLAYYDRFSEEVDSLYLLSIARFFHPSRKKLIEFWRFTHDLHVDFRNRYELPKEDDEWLFKFKLKDEFGVDIEELYREADKWAEEESNDNTRSKSVP